MTRRNTPRPAPRPLPPRRRLLRPVSAGTPAPDHSPQPERPDHDDRDRADHRDGLQRRPVEHRPEEHRKRTDEQRPEGDQGAAAGADPVRQPAHPRRRVVVEVGQHVREVHGDPER